MTTEDPISLLFRLGLGPWLMPLRGKIPVLDAWQTLPPVDEARVRQWVAMHYNLGFRCGAQSGWTVIDDDQAKHGVPPEKRYVLPPSGLRAATPTGGEHRYYRTPASDPHNSTSVLAPYVDVRGWHGYVVVAPSIHPDTRTAYSWIETGEAGEFPAITAQLTIDMTAPAAAPTGAGYAATALVRETARVRAAPEGTRNDTLVRAAFNLGQLVAGGALESGAVAGELASAAAIAGLDQREATSTIANGMRAGANTPRAVPAKSAGSRPLTSAHVGSRPDPATVPSADVLVPGSHTLPGGEYVEQGNHAFAEQTLAALNPGALYRRSGAVGELHNDAFVSVSADRARTIIDASVRLTAGKPGGEDEEPVIVYRPCTRDNASVVLDYASVRGRIRELKHIASHPVCVGADFTPAQPGWNPDSGVYLTCTLRIETLALETARAVLDDLICDFPFATPADKANYIGLLLTVILRPAINEPVPMHLITSPVERTGKTKLAEIVLGCGILGRPTPAMQLGVREEEIEKRITASLYAGDSVMHLDNLREFFDSPSFASLLTATEYRGRELGRSRMMSLTNGVTIVGTGNNVHATGEISKRIVPIVLQPATESPETRQDYRHPLLRAYVESQRARVLGALLGLIQTWRDDGRPLAPVRIGGFERWSAVVGGIMLNAGYSDWCGNLAAWRGDSDDFGAELKAFVAAWADQYGQKWVETGLLYDIAESHDLFARQLSKDTERGRKTAFAARIINSVANRVVGEQRIEVDGTGRKRRARLVLV